MRLLQNNTSVYSFRASHVKSHVTHQHPITHRPEEIGPRLHQVCHHVAQSQDPSGRCSTAPMTGKTCLFCSEKMRQKKMANTNHIGKEERKTAFTLNLIMIFKFGVSFLRQASIILCSILQGFLGPAANEKTSGPTKPFPNYERHGNFIGTQ